MLLSVTMIKYHLSGTLMGTRTKEIMSFVDWSVACNWAARATMNPDCSFVVLEMKNSETGEVEKF